MDLLQADVAAIPAADGAAVDLVRANGLDEPQDRLDAAGATKTVLRLVGQPIYPTNGPIRQRDSACRTRPRLGEGALQDVGSVADDSPCPLGEVMDLTALKTELGNAQYANKGDEEIAAMLSVVNRQANRDSLTGGELAASISRSDFTALTAADKQYVQMLVTAATLPTTATLKTELGAIFPAGSTTRAALVALLKRPGTRAEELGLGAVTPSDVANARRS